MGWWAGGMVGRWDGGTESESESKMDVFPRAAHFVARFARETPLR